MEAEQIPWEPLPAPKTWDEYVAGVKLWLQATWGTDDKPCEYCGGSDWSLGPVFLETKAPGWPDMGGGPNVGFPIIPLTCMGCAQMVFIHALWIFLPQNPVD